MHQSFPELKTPEAKKLARAIAEEAWASKMLTVSDPMLRRLGSMLVLQELRERMGICHFVEKRPYTRKERPEPPPSCGPDDAPDTLRSPPPMFEEPRSGRELTCKGCEVTKPEEEFYRSTSSRSGRQSLCRPCFNVHYRRSRPRSVVT